MSSQSKAVFKGFPVNPALLHHVQNQRTLLFSVLQDSVSGWMPEIRIREIRELRKIGLVDRLQRRQGADVAVFQLLPLIRIKAVLSQRKKRVKRVGGHLRV